MAKKAHNGPSKSQLLKKHGDLYLQMLQGRASSRELTEDSMALEAQGISFQQIIEIRQKVKDKYERGGVGIAH